MPNAYFTTKDGLDIHYRIDGSGPWVTLIHGVGADLGNWDEVAGRLAVDFTVLRVDLRGHGRSGRMLSCRLADFVDDLSALLATVGATRTDLVGFSLGGLIAEQYAITHPPALRRLALISTVAERTEEERARVLKRADQIDREGIAAVVAAATDRWFTPEFKAANPDRVQRRLDQLIANDHRSYAAAYRVFAEADKGLRFEDIDVPTLIMTGEEDTGSSPRMARVLSEGIKTSELRILPKLLHSVLIEAPDLIAGLLLDFLGKP